MSEVLSMNFVNKNIHIFSLKTYVINENLSTPINESLSLWQFDVKCILAESKSFLIVVITISIYFASRKQYLIMQGDL